MPEIETHREKLVDQARDIQEEARMVLPGVQALFGFQLVAAFNQRFTELEVGERALHLISLLLVTLCIALLMAPAAYHRTAERGTVSPHFIELSSYLIASAMLPLALAIGVDVYVVTRLALPDLAPSLTIGLSVAVVALLALLWFGLPIWRKGRVMRRSASYIRLRE